MSSRGSGGRSNGTLPQTKICQFKLVLLGDMAVGKSSLVLRFVKGQFDEFQETTIGGEVQRWLCRMRDEEMFLVFTRCSFLLVFLQLRSWLSLCV